MNKSILKKLPALLVILVVIGGAQTFTSCSSDDGNNGGVSSSSDGNIQSTSSSSTDEASSSSSAELSSSSIAPSSSSSVPSSSSAESSSSSVVPSSSSSVPSSSSAEPSSSSVVPSSSSVGCPVSAVSERSVTCGGQIYRTVKIGEQIWFAENLNYDPGVGNSACYDNDPENCDIYGRLYDWVTVMGFSSNCNTNSCSNLIKEKHQGICPDGWHIPSEADWDELMEAVGGSETAGIHLKATTGWRDCGPSGSNSSYVCEDTYNFSAMPGGYSGSEVDRFFGAGNQGEWWSAKEYGGSSLDFAYYRRMFYSHEYVFWGAGSGKPGVYSVRCVQD